MNDTTIIHVQDYIKRISNIIDSKDTDNFIITYRGECKEYPTPCVPNIYREEYLKTYDFFEKNIFDEMRANKISKGEKYLENAISAQHDGFPSRLLDVSYNSLVALYFAITPYYRLKETEYDEDNGKVFLFFIDKLFCPTGDNITKAYEEIIRNKNTFLNNSIFSKNHKLIDHSEERNRIRDAKKYGICKKKGITLIRITDNAQYEIMINCDHKITIPKADDFHLSYAISKLLFKLNKPANVDVAANRLVILQYLTSFDNSLEELFPELAKEWNYDKNGFPPCNIHPGSNEKVWWICKKCGKEWKTSPSERTGRDKTGCPICSRKEGAKKRTKTTLIKRGSVADKAAFLLDEWDYEKNKITPDSIPCTSPKKVWWKCKKCGYNWQTSIEHRVKRQSGCPCCRNQVVVKELMT